MNIWKQRYDEMIKTCALTAKQRDKACAKIEELEDALNLPNSHHQIIIPTTMKYHNECFPQCSGDPACCPENSGHGCCKPNPPALPVSGTRLVEAQSPGPRLEMFARRKRGGWASWGNEITPDVEI